MKKVLVFAGTTEGRELAELLADSNIKCSVCVATDYALELMNDKRLDVNCGVAPIEWNSVNFKVSSAATEAAIGMD